MNNPKLPEFDIQTFLAEEHIEWGDTDFYVSTEQSFLILPSRAFRTNFYVIAICSEGSARIKLNLHEHFVSPNTLLSVTPHHIVQVMEHTSNLNARIIFFTKPFLFNNHVNAHVLDNLGFSRPGNYNALTVNEEDAGSLKSFFELIREKAAKEHYPYRKEVVRHLIISLLYQIDALYQHHSSDFTGKLSRKEELNRRFHDLLRDIRILAR